MHTRTKILYLITKSNWGGAQRYVYDLATGAVAAGFSVTVAAGGGGQLADMVRAAGIPVVTLGALHRDVHLMREWYALREILALLKRERPDVFHINSSKAGGMGALAARIAGVPRIVFTAHGWAFNESRPLWQRLVIKMLHWITVLLAHQTIAVSEAIRRQMNWPFARRKMCVIHNGRALPNLMSTVEARASLYAQFPELERYAADTWSVGIAELHPTKQHDVMIRAMHDVVSRAPRARHIIMGGGELYDTLADMIVDEGLAEHVFLLGAVPDAARYLRAFAFLVLPSRSEAMPYTPIEACIAGIPTIASAVGGIPEIIRHGDEGLLVASGDSEGLADAYVTLLQDTSLRARLAAHAHARAAHFSVDHMRAETYARYRR